MGWTLLYIPNLQRLQRWNLGMYNQFRNGQVIPSYILLGMWIFIHVGIKLIHVSNRGPRRLVDTTYDAFDCSFLICDFQFDFYLIARRFATIVFIVVYHKTKNILQNFYV